MKFQDMRNNQENILASTVGQQMKQIGEAVNGYINIKYDKLSTLSNAAGTGMIRDQEHVLVLFVKLITRH